MYEMSDEPRYNSASILISKAAEASRMMTHIERLEIMVKAGLVTWDQVVEKLAEKHQMPESYVRQMLAIERGESINDVIEVKPGWRFWNRMMNGMSDELKALIEKARHYKMTPEERYEQLISLAYGNGHFDNSKITMDDVRAVAERLYPDRKVE